MRCYWRNTSSEYRLQTAILLQLGRFNPKFQVEGGCTHQPFFFQKTRLNDLSYGIKIWTDNSSILSQFMRLTDEHTDRLLIARLRLHYMQRFKNI